MNNIRTMQRLLPPELIIDNYILNEEYSYEDYLVDFINCSSFFKRLSHGEDYQGIPKKEQNNGECDCESCEHKSECSGYEDHDDIDEN